MDGIRAYLTELKNRSGMSWTALEKATGISESAIRKIFSGETTDPRFGTVQSLVNAMGGSMEGAGSEKEQEKEAEHGDIYAEHIEEIRQNAEKQIRSLRRDKTILAFTAGILLFIIIALLVLDLAFGTKGWIRY